MPSKLPRKKSVSKKPRAGTTAPRRKGTSKGTPDSPGVQPSSSGLFDVPALTSQEIDGLIGPLGDSGTSSTTPEPHSPLMSVDQWKANREARLAERRHLAAHAEMLQSWGEAFEESLQKYPETEAQKTATAALVSPVSVRDFHKHVRDLRHRQAVLNADMDTLMEYAHTRRWSEPTRVQQAMSRDNFFQSLKEDYIPKLEKWLNSNGSEQVLMMSGDQLAGRPWTRGTIDDITFDRHELSPSEPENDYNRVMNGNWEQKPLEHSGYLMPYHMRWNPATSSSSTPGATLTPAPAGTLESSKWYHLTVPYDQSMGTGLTESPESRVLGTIRESLDSHVGPVTEDQMLEMIPKEVLLVLGGGIVTWLVSTLWRAGKKKGSVEAIEVVKKQLEARRQVLYKQAAEAKQRRQEETNRIIRKPTKVEVEDLIRERDPVKEES